MDTKDRADASARTPSPPLPAAAQVEPMPRLITAHEAAHAPSHTILLRGFFGSGN
jgi:hypothetical protein